MTLNLQYSCLHLSPQCWNFMCVSACPNLWKAGDWAQGFMLDKQALYQLNYSSIYGIQCLGQEFECKTYTWYMKEAGKEWIRDRNEKVANLLGECLELTKHILKRRWICPCSFSPFFPGLWKRRCQHLHWPPESVRGYPHTDGIWIPFRSIWFQNIM